MTVIVDANVLLRHIDLGSSMHVVATSALTSLRSNGDVLRALPQCFYEFWVVATRPVVNNGLGLSTVETDVQLMTLEATFPLIHDPASLYADWRSLVVGHDCKGKVAHDARIAAAMQAHGLTHLLTFNGGDFARFPDIAILDPLAVAAPQP